MRRLLFDGFIENWQQTPDATALELAGGCHSYRALGDWASSVAATLCHVHGHADPGIIGLLGDHSASTYAALLGISMTGSAYLPLGAAQPVERLADMINRAACAGIGSINAVYFEIEVKNAAPRADAQGRMAWSTAAAARFATEFR